MRSNLAGDLHDVAAVELRVLEREHALVRHAVVLDASGSRIRTTVPRWLECTVTSCIIAPTIGKPRTAVRVGARVAPGPFVSYHYVQLALGAESRLDLR